MAEETGSGLLSRLLGALTLGPSAGTESAQESPESRVQESARQGSSQLPALDSSPAKAFDGVLHRSSSGDSDNPQSIFGLPAPAGHQKPDDAALAALTAVSYRPPADHQKSDDDAVTEEERVTKNRSRGKKSRQGGGKRSAAEPRPTAKKPPMRTARDVISRIQWDRNLPEDYFDIGYLDRFLGVLDKPFASFTWGDLPWQENDVLAIPQHRIQYFKYRGVKVWDKASRLDAVFGSAGTSEEIEAAMTRIDAEVELERQRRAAEALLAGTDADPFADSSEDDEEVDVVLQPAVTAVPGALPDEARSTHFLAVRVSCPALRAAAERVQASVVRHDPSLGACAMRPTLMHVTLCMLRLEDAEAAAAAGRCLRETIADLGETLRADDRALRMRGLKTFGARVLYSPVAPCSSFNVAVETLRTRLASVTGVHVTNAFEYVPHMTLVKVSRPVARARRSRFIDAAGYTAFEREELGEQRFDNVQLCAIDADCALDGFYVTESSVTF